LRAQRKYNTIVVNVKRFVSIFKKSLLWDRMTFCADSRADANYLQGSSAGWL
jgi:hypothetical protein